MIKDIIISRKIATHHYSRLFMDRIETDKSDNELRYEYLVKYFNENSPNLPDLDKIMSIIQSLTVDNMDSYYPVFNYLGLYVDVYNRLDLIDTAGFDKDMPVYVYLNSPNEGAVAIASEDEGSSSLSDCVMNLFIHKLTVNPSLAGIINLQFELDSYNSLASVGAGYDYNSNSFYNLITSKGKELKIYIK